MIAGWAVVSRGEVRVRWMWGGRIVCEWRVASARRVSLGVEKCCVGLV